MRGVAMMQCSRGMREGGGQWACFSAANSLAKGSNMSSPSSTQGGKQAREGSTERIPMNSTMEVTGNKLAVSYTLRETEQNKHREKGRKERGKRNRKEEVKSELDNGCLRWPASYSEAKKKKSDKERGEGKAPTCLHQTRRSCFPRQWMIKSNS